MQRNNVSTHSATSEQSLSEKQGADAIAVSELANQTKALEASDLPPIPDGGLQAWLTIAGS